MEIFREFTFDAAHRLDNLPPAHKCARLHGHTYRLIVHVQGNLDPKMGWVIDFAEIKRITHETIDQLDHHYLNDIEGLAQPTAENIVMWIWDRLKPGLPALSKLVLWENANSGVTYLGDPPRPTNQPSDRPNNRCHPRPDGAVV